MSNSCKVADLFKDAVNFSQNNIQFTFILSKLGKRNFGLFRFRISAGLQLNSVAPWRSSCASSSESESVQELLLPEVQLLSLPSRRTTWSFHHLLRRLYLRPDWFFIEVDVLVVYVVSTCECCSEDSYTVVAIAWIAKGFEKETREIQIRQQNNEN